MPFPFLCAAGLVACKIYRRVRARRLWDLIMASTYDFAEPGFILVDEINQMNNNWFCENVRATNPCGEQPLPPYGACLLGSINLTKVVLDPFTDRMQVEMAEHAAGIERITFSDIWDLASQRREAERAKREIEGGTAGLDALPAEGRYVLDSAEQFGDFDVPTLTSRSSAISAWR